MPGAYNPQAFDRFAYVLNNPLNYNDPSGHGSECLASTNRDACEAQYNDVSPILPHQPQYAPPPPTSTPPPPTSMVQAPIRTPTLVSASEPYEIIPTITPSPPSYYVQQSGIQTSAITSYSWISEPPESSNYNPVVFDPAEPDYWNISGSIGEGAGVTGNVLIDRYGDIYIGLSGNIGKSLTFVSGNISRGWIGDPMDNYYPSPNESSQFLEGFSVNVAAGLLGGGGITINPTSNNEILGYEVGIYSPQIGISAGWTWKFVDRR